MDKKIHICIQILLITFMYSSEKTTECDEFQKAFQNQLKCESKTPSDTFWSLESDDKAYEMSSFSDPTIKFLVRAIYHPSNEINSVKPFQKYPNEVKAIYTMNSKFALALFGNFQIGDTLFILYECLKPFTIFNQKTHGEDLKDNQKLYKFIAKLSYAIADFHFNCNVNANLNIQSIMMIDDSPKITNFNYAVPHDKPYEFHGSLAYASPEFISSCFGDLSTPELQNKLITELSSDPSYVLNKMKNSPTQGYENDMYALGVVIYTLTQGKLPFDETKVLETIMKKLEGKLTIEKAINSKVKDIIHGLMTNKPEDRFNRMDLLMYLNKSNIIDESKSFDGVIDLKINNLSSLGEDRVPTHTISVSKRTQKKIDNITKNPESTFDFQPEYSAEENNRFWDFTEQLSKVLYPEKKTKQLETHEMTLIGNEKHLI